MREKNTVRRPQASVVGKSRSLSRPWHLLRALLPLFLLILVGQTAWASDGLETQLGERLGGLLQGGKASGWAYGIAFLAGVFTSLTPCVYPMIPITIGLFGAKKQAQSRLASLGLAACYVGGIALMYTTLGIVVGLTGAKFGNLMVSPYVMGPIAVFFIVMAASMFGAFELQLPEAWNSRLSQVGGSGPIGAVGMGLVAGLVAAPCTGPPLAALLLFVGTQQSVFLGGSLLFVYALGMGVLFFALAGFALRMPRSGNWMDTVKLIFGVIMLVAALYFLRNVLPAVRGYGQYRMKFLALHLGLVVAGVLVRWVSRAFQSGAASALGKILVAGFLTIGLYGVVAWMLAPRELGWLTDEATAVAQAKAQHKPLLIDFGAEWCLPCKELERRTFSHDDIKAELSRFVVVRIDATDPTPAVAALQQKYRAETLPAVVVLDSLGNEALRVQEFVTADKLLPILSRIQ